MTEIKEFVGMKSLLEAVNNFLYRRPATIFSQNNRIGIPGTGAIGICDTDECDLFSTDGGSYVTNARIIGDNDSCAFSDGCKIP